MRYNLLKKHSTKAERIMYEILKEFRIDFKHRWLIQGKEVDFLINKTVIEINGHEQNSERNEWLVKLGYTPIHFNNKELLNRELIKQKIKQLWN